MEVRLYTAPCFVGSSDRSHGSFTQIGDTGVFVRDAEALLLSSHAALLIHWRLATGPFLFRLEDLIDIAMSDEWQWIVFTFSHSPHQDALTSLNRLPVVSLRYHFDADEGNPRPCSSIRHEAPTLSL